MVIVAVAPLAACWEAGSDTGSMLLEPKLSFGLENPRRVKLPRRVLLWFVGDREAVESNSIANAA